AVVTIADGANAGKSATTDISGTYHFDPLQSSGFTAIASANTYVPSSKGVTLTSSQTLPFSLTHASPSLTGIFMASSGARIGGATVTVLDGPNVGRTTMTDSTGAYRFDNLSVGNAN